MRRAAKSSEPADTPPQQATAIARMCPIASDTPTLRAPHGAHVADGQVADSQVADKHLHTGPVIAQRDRTFSAAKAADRRACKCRVSGVSAICQWSEEGMSA